MHRAPTLLTLAAAGAAAAAPAAAQSASSSYVFYSLQGQDTVAVEEVVRTPESLEVDMRLLGDGVRFAFTLELRPDATVDRVVNRFYRQLDDEEPTQVVTVTFRPDSADVEIRGGDTRTMTVAAPPGAIPWIRPSHTLIEQMLLRADEMEGTIDRVPVFNVANGQTGTAQVDSGREGEATLRLAEALITAERRADGMLEAYSIRGQPFRVVRVEGH